MIQTKSGLRIERFEFELLGSNMYLLLSDEEENTAWLIDPHRSREALQLLKKCHIDKLRLLLTHEHYDHTSGVNYYCENFDTEVICQQHCAQLMRNPRNNRPLIIASMLLGNRPYTPREREMMAAPPFVCFADRVFEERLTLRFGDGNLLLVSTPGHSAGSCCMLIGDELIFSGDSLLRDNAVITRFPGGSERDFKESTLPFLLQLSARMTVCPGHGTPFPVAEAAWIFDMEQEQI